MKAFTIYYCLLLGTFGSSIAQYKQSESDFRIGIETGLGLATGNSPYSYGTSLNFFGRYAMSTQLSLLASVGYQGLFTKDTSPIPDVHFIPFKAIIKIFPIDENFYSSLGVGAGFGTIKGSKVAFLCTGALGYEWLTGYDFAIKYEGYGQQVGSTTYHPFNAQLIAAFSCHF